jgi:hypothetical protein
MVLLDPLEQMAALAHPDLLEQLEVLALQAVLLGLLENLATLDPPEHLDHKEHLDLV